MNSLKERFYKPVLVVVLIASLVAVSFTQKKLNVARASLGLTRGDPLENAPPILAFTTVALGGFRGLIANILWIRASDLQEDGKYFEMVTLAGWITKLQPRIPTVWYHQAWNMAYNISIKFQDPRDRWQWVRRGIELLRDEGLRYNPQETLLYRELAWFFQHKMGHNLDDGHLYFKQVWADSMYQVLGSGKVNFDDLINPKTDEQRKRAQALREVYKLDPRKMKEFDERFGPLEWRLPEAHSVYWAALGLENSKPEELMTLRRSIYQSMQLSFQRGRLIENRFDRTFEFGPNLEIIPKVSASYEQMQKDEPTQADHIGTGHKNFLKDAVYFLYTHNRQKEAMAWMKYLKEKYPTALPPNTDLDSYAVERVTEVASETSVDRTKAVLQGLISQSFYYLGLGDDDQSLGYDRLAQKVWARFQVKIATSTNRISLPAMPVLKQDVLQRMLDPERGVNPLLAAQLRTALNLPAPATNAPATTAPTAISTNAPAVAPAGKAK